MTVTDELMRIHRRRTIEEGDVQMEFVNLVEEITQPDGTVTKEHYDIRFSEMDERQDIQTLTIDYRVIKKATDKFYRHYDPIDSVAARKFSGGYHSNYLPEKRSPIDPCPSNLPPFRPAPANVTLRRRRVRTAPTVAARHGADLPPAVRW